MKKDMKKHFDAVRGGGFSHIFSIFQPLIWGNDGKTYSKTIESYFSTRVEKSSPFKSIYFEKITPAIDRVIKLPGFGGFKQAANVW